MAIMNQWGDGNDEGLGDVIYDSLEQEVKDKAGDLAKDGADKASHAAGKALDKATDRIEPVKAIKDKVKEKLSNNPVTRAKAAVKKAKQKVKDGARKLAKQGIKALGRAIVEGVKAAAGFVATHPIASAIIFIILLLIIAKLEIDMDDGNSMDGQQGDEILLDSPVYVNLDGMSDDDIVVILMDDCIEQQYDIMNDMVDTEKEEKAKSIYSVFHSYGFNNVSIAGILANLDKESGLDASAIEGIFSEYGVLGTRKAAALLSLSNYTENTLFPSYKSSGTSFSRDGYRTTNADGDLVYYCGIGLAQWTAGNAKMLLTAAENLKMDWYSMDFQLGYMISDAIYRPGFFAEWVDDQEDDYSFDINDYNLSDYASQADYDKAVEEGKKAAYTAALENAKESAVHFAHGYEGNTAHDDERKAAAAVWYEIIFEWGDDDTDSDYSESIVGLATELGTIIEFKEIEEAQYRCLSGNVFDNSSLAAAAISLAWPTREQSFNNGTNLYQTVHDTIFPKDYIYKACDRTVATAVQWSGADVQFPRGSTADQIRYMETSSKWMRLGPAGSLSMDDLQPGDVFIINGHTFIYVSESAIQSAYAGEAKMGSDSVSGSLNERSPGCDSSTTSIMNRGGEDWEGRGMYSVYRCTDPDNSSKWKGIGSGMTN